MRKMKVFAKGLRSSFLALGFLILMGVGLFGPQEAGAAAITSIGTGNWSATAWPNTLRTGTITTSNASTTVTGSGTTFTTEISVGNIIKTTGNVAIGTVASIQSNTQLTLTANAASTNTAINYNFQGVGPVDTVTIATGNTVTVDVNATCASLTFPTTSTVATAVSISGTNTLTVTGAVSLPRASAASNTINVNAGTFSAASVTLSGTTGGSRTTIINISTGTITVSGNITSAGVDSRIVFSGSGTLNAGGNFMSGTAGTFTASTGTVNYNGASQTVGAYTYNNLTFSGSGAKTMATGTVVNNVLSIAPTGAATANLNAGINLTISRLTLAGLGRVNGTWGSTSSTATNTNNTFFAATTGRLTVTNDTRIASSITGSPTGSAITYPAQLSTSTLSGGTATPAGGTFTWTTPATVPNAGTTTAGVTYTPTDPTSYTIVTGTGNIIVNKATPTLSVTNSPVNYDGTAKAATVTGSVPGSVSSILTGGVASQTNAGTYAVTANFTPTDSTNYNSLTSASAGNFLINKVTPTASVSNSPVAYDTTAKSAAVSCLGGGAANNILTGGVANQTDAGTYAVTADCAASANYNAASGVAAGSFVIDKAAQTIGVITFTPPTLTVAGTTTASATATSGLPVNFSSDTLAVCTVSGSTVTGISAGTCIIRAIQAGNGNYNAAAPEVTQSLAVTSGTATLTITTAGLGSGTVYSSPGTIACASNNPANCSDSTFVVPTDVTLTAAPDWKSEVVWSGGCTGTGLSCGPFTLNGNTDVTATFNFKQLVMMPGPAYYATIQDAYNAAAVDAVLKTRDQVFTENLVFNGVNVTFDGGYEATWTTASGFTAINGDVTIIAGGVTVSNMVIQ